MSPSRVARLVVCVVACIAISRAHGAPPDPLSFTTQGVLTVAGGTLTFDTDTLQVTGGGVGVVNATGDLYSQGGGNPDVAVFTFSSVLIGSGVTVQVVGSRPVAILSHTNMQVDANLNVSGSNGAGGPAHGSPAPSGANGVNGAEGNVGGFGGPAPVAPEPGGKGGDGGFDEGNGQMGNPGSGGALGGSPGIASGDVGDTSGPGGPGTPGAPGAPGPGGTGGVGAAGGGSFVIKGGATGNSGAAGLNGKGGGGGGGGGGGADGFVANPDKGGGGGAGGAGGLGGNLGQGGGGGRAISLGAIGSVQMNGFLVSTGGNGGNGAGGQFGGIGGTGGSGFDDSGPGGNGGNGGNGGAGGPGGGGAGGTVHLFGDQIHAPSTLTNLGGGTGGTNPLAAIGGPGGSGLFRYEGSLVLDVTSLALHDLIDVDGRIDPAGDVEFVFASEGIADAFDSTFTLDDFFVQSGGPVPSVSPFLPWTYSGTSPTRMFDITLNSDRTFDVTVVPEPASAALLLIGAAAGALMLRRRNARYSAGKGRRMQDGG